MTQISLMMLRFFAHHTGIAILSVLLAVAVSMVIISLRRFDVMYRSPRRYLMGSLNLIVTVSIFLFASPFWAVVIKGYFNFPILLATLSLLVLILLNIIMTIEFFTGKRILKALVDKIAGRRQKMQTGGNDELVE